MLIFEWLSGGVDTTIANIGLATDDCDDCDLNHGGDLQTIW